MEEQPSERSQQPLASPVARGSGEGGSAARRYALLGCGVLLLLSCVCLAAAVGTFAFLQWRAGTPTPGPVAQRTPAARIPITRTPLTQTTPPPDGARDTPTPATPAAIAQTPVPQTASTPAPAYQASTPQTPSSSGLPEGWQIFDDPSGQVRLAIPAGWNVYWEEFRCCNVTLTSFDPGQLPSGRLNWGPPGSGAEHEVPPSEMVVDLFVVAPPFAEGPIDFGRPPDGEDIVGSRYPARLYFSAPFTDWPTGQVITYLWEDERGQQWCLIAYFGTSFEQDQEQLTTLGQLVATIRHGSP